MENPPSDRQLSTTSPLDELDPAGLLRLGMASDFADGTGAAFAAPTIDELTAAMPQFEIQELIGKGGMGAVYKVRQKELDRVVALKILPRDVGNQHSFPERFAREARALAKLNHPGIVTIHEFGNAGGFYFILMEFVDGVNLRQLLAGSRISPREALAIVPQICDALQFAHDRGIVHRDIKPEDILIDRLGRVKVADFGLAKLANSKTEASTDLTSITEPLMTEAGRVLGTPDYMAPEQVERPDEVDHRADIYALGVVLYQMLTGKLPDREIEAPSRKVSVDVRLDEIVVRALERDPERRYQQASVMKTQAEEVGKSGGVASATHWRNGFEYKSNATLLGLPWLHVAGGIDPQTGRGRVAKGIVAIGDRARGVIAVGGSAAGGVAIGGLATGVFACGGLAAGLISFGGLSLALLVAIGGVAVGAIAMGGSAIGYYGFGASVYGMHVADSDTRDPEALRFFANWAPDLMADLGMVAVTLILISLALSVGVPAWLMRKSLGAAYNQQTPSRTRSRTLLITIALLPLAGAMLIRLAQGMRNVEFTTDITSTQPVRSDLEKTNPAPPIGEISITILGEVANPGSYQLAAGSSLLDAIAQAGGWTERANLRKVMVGNSANPALATCNLSNILSGAAGNPALEHRSVITLTNASY